MKFFYSVTMGHFWMKIIAKQMQSTYKMHKTLLNETVEIKMAGL